MPAPIVRTLGLWSVLGLMCCNARYLFQASTYTGGDGKHSINLNSLGVPTLSLQPHSEGYHRQAGEKNANGGDGALSHVSHQEGMGGAAKVW